RYCAFFFSSRRRHTRSDRDWSSDVCSSDLAAPASARVLPTIQSRCRKLPLRPLAKDDVVRAAATAAQIPVDDPALAAAAVAAEEIGRASCRERVGSGGGAGAVRTNSDGAQR